MSPLPHTLLCSPALHPVQGFMSEEMDVWVASFVLPAFTPTMGLFLAISTGYGLWKVGAAWSCCEWGRCCCWGQLLCSAMLLQRAEQHFLLLHALLPATASTFCPGGLGGIHLLTAASPHLPPASPRRRGQPLRRRATDRAAEELNQSLLGIVCIG